MCKAEEGAYKAYPYNGDYRGQGDSNSKFREAYINGYHQAEKDLALTWEDINRIEIIIKDVYRDYPHGIEVKQFGMEVSNRFNKIKGK